MARVIETRLEAGTERSLVPLCETGQRPPLFLIAGIGGLLGVAAGRGIYALGHQFAPMIVQTSNMPWPVMAFLSDAHGRGVLRQAGGVYQFRHARLRDYLALEGAVPSDAASGR